jgi:hypothetical protein
MKKVFQEPKTRMGALDGIHPGGLKNNKTQVKFKNPKPKKEKF